MKNIILTLDYELYGNGSGNVFRHIIEPTEKGGIIMYDIHFCYFAKW